MTWSIATSSGACGFLGSVLTVRGAPLASFPRYARASTRGVRSDATSRIYPFHRWFQAMLIP